MSTFDLFIEAGENAKQHLNDAILHAYDGKGEECNLAVKAAIAMLEAMAGPLAPPDSQREPTP